MDGHLRQVYHLLNARVYLLLSAITVAPVVAQYSPWRHRRNPEINPTRTLTPTQSGKSAITSDPSIVIASDPSIVIASEARQSRQRRRRRPRNAIANDDTTPLPYYELMLYNGFTGDKSVPSTRFRAFTANQHQVAAGLCRRLSPTALIGAVPSATAPATARHASGMENESKNHSAPPPAVGLIPLGTWSTLSKSSPVHPKHREEAHSSIDLNPSRQQWPSPVCCWRANPITGAKHSSLPMIGGTPSIPQTRSSDLVSSPSCAVARRANPPGNSRFRQPSTRRCANSDGPAPLPCAHAARLFTGAPCSRFRRQSRHNVACPRYPRGSPSMAQDWPHL